MAIDFGRMARGVATGYLSAKIANTEANDALNADILRAAGLEYHTKTLPEHRKTEKQRASEYKQISLLLESEEAAHIDERALISTFRNTIAGNKSSSENL